MKIGLIKEIKKHEYRVGLTPDNVKEYINSGHDVVVQSGAGIGAGFSDEAYISAGAKISSDKKSIFDESDMIVKVKEPLPEEYELFHEGQILYTYLHLAPNRELTQALLEKRVSGVAYETITDKNGHLPCLTPMSEIAGKLATQEGAKYLEKPFGGRGVLLGGVPGVERGEVVIIGGGVVGQNALKIAVGMGANVTILDINAQLLAHLDDLYGSKITTLYSNRTNLVNSLKKADLLIGAVLLPGAAAPKLVSKEDLSLMKPRSVIVDVAIDQGGCIETSHATYHDEPTFIVDDIVHYCVANMPGAVSLTSTLALTSTTLPFGLEIANKGLKRAMSENPNLLNGLNTYMGKCTYQAVANSLNIEYSKASLL